MDMGMNKDAMEYYAKASKSMRMVEFPEWKEAMKNVIEIRRMTLDYAKEHADKETDMERLRQYENDITIIPMKIEEYENMIKFVEQQGKKMNLVLYVGGDGICEMPMFFRNSYAERSMVQWNMTKNLDAEMVRQ